jgi:HTH-type transcriptional regulator / antitoxin HigA
MPLAFDRKQYTALLAKYQPKLIETHEDYRQALAVVEYFVFKKERSAEELALYDLALLLVKTYESQKCPMDNWRTQSPTEMLQYLLETSGKKQSDLVGMILVLRGSANGSSGVVAEIVNGKRTISKAQSKKLGEIFQVSPSLFI